MKKTNTGKVCMPSSGSSTSGPKPLSSSERGIGEGSKDRVGVFGSQQFLSATVWAPGQPTFGRIEKIGRGKTREGS